jgi:hypothetical protein
MPEPTPLTPERIEEIERTLNHCRPGTGDFIRWAKAHGRDLLAEVERQAGEIAALKGRSMCIVCCGKGDPGTGSPCICGGSGDAQGAQQALTIEVYKLDQNIAKLEAERGRLQSRLDALQRKE